MGDQHRANKKVLCLRKEAELLLCSELPRPPLMRPCASQRGAGVSLPNLARLMKSPWDISRYHAAPSRTRTRWLGRCVQLSTTARQVGSRNSYRKLTTIAPRTMRDASAAHPSIRMGQAFANVAPFSLLSIAAPLPTTRCQITASHATL